MNDKGETTKVVEHGPVADYEIDDCDLCYGLVLRPLCAPEEAKAICSKCLPEVMVAATKIRKHMIMPDGIITEGAN